MTDADVAFITPFVRDAAAELGSLERVDELSYETPEGIRLFVRDMHGGIGHADIAVELQSKDLAETTLWDCIAFPPEGVTSPENRAAYASMQADIWRGTTLAVARSLVTGTSDLANHVGSTDEGGVPGFHLCYSSTVVWGPGECSLLAGWFGSVGAFGGLAQPALDDLDPARLNSLKVVVGGSDDDPIAEVRLNGEQHDAAGLHLLGLDWPRSGACFARTYGALFSDDV